MKGKIGLIAAIALTLVLVATTVVLGVVQKDYAPSVQTNYQSVTITKAGDPSFNYTAGKLDDGEDFEKVVGLYNNSFKQSMLASIFSGNNSNKISVVYESGSVPQISSGYKMVWFLNSQGEKVNLTNNLQTEYLVNKLTVAVEDSNGFKTTTIYANIVDSGVNAHIRIATIANFEALYDYLETLNS